VEPVSTKYCDCAADGGAARGGHDDVFAIATLEVALRAVQRFQQEVWERCHLRLQWQKTQLFSWDGETRRRIVEAREKTRSLLLTSKYSQIIANLLPSHDQVSAK
jgi:hypothetical protein